MTLVAGDGSFCLTMLMVLIKLPIGVVVLKAETLVGVKTKRICVSPAIIVIIKLCICTCII